MVCYPFHMKFHSTRLRTLTHRVLCLSGTAAVLVTFNYVVFVFADPWIWLKYHVYHMSWHVLAPWSHIYIYTHTHIFNGYSGYTWRGDNSVFSKFDSVFAQGSQYVWRVPGILSSRRHDLHLHAALQQVPGGRECADSGPHSAWCG